MGPLTNEEKEDKEFQDYLDREKRKKRMAFRLIHCAACDGFSVDDFREACDIAKAIAGSQILQKEQWE